MVRYELDIDFKMPDEDSFKHLERPHHPEGHPFRKTSFWKRSVLYKSDRLIACIFLTPAGETVPWHHDDIAWTTFNYVINGNSPFVYKTGETYYYKCGLFDVRPEHMVPSDEEDRLLLKYSLIKRTFEDEEPMISKKLKGINKITHEEMIEILK